MSEIEQTLFFGWRCDKRGCGAEFRDLGPDEQNYFRAQNGPRQRAEEAGWTFWASRGRRSYCGDHGPSRGSKQWRVPSRPLHGGEPS